MDEVEALTELKSRISADDWRTICNYVFKERELADQMLALSRNDVLEEAGDMAEVTDVVERVARAIWTTPLLDQPEPNYVRNWPPQYPEVRDEVRNQARAALAAMLEAVGEPVAMMMQHAEFERIELEEHSTGRTYLTDGDRKAGWTETPLYSLAALREEL